jgi:peptide-methionine (S)-S-oxide reductase
MMATRKASFAAGCFWGVEARFREIPGVLDAAVGYMGGTTAEPTYEHVCSGMTGHAETVQLEYDDQQLSYAELLDQFFALHNPTTLNRQGPDRGTQYRSVIFWHEPEQQHLAREKIRQVDASGKWASPVVTQVEPAGEFWRAEEYHQRYLEKNGGGFCHL